MLSVVHDPLHNLPALKSSLVENEFYHFACYEKHIVSASFLGTTNGDRITFEGRKENQKWIKLGARLKFPIEAEYSSIKRMVKLFERDGLWSMIPFRASRSNPVFVCVV
jgi:hypothetical protein